MPKGLGSWPRAPLVLSVIEIGYAKRAKFSEEAAALGDLQTRGLYPFVEEGTLKEFKVQTSPEKIEVTTEDSPSWVLANESKTVAARVLPTKLTFFDADYEGDFTGSLRRLHEVLDTWSRSAASLTITEVRVRTFDVALPPESIGLQRWLRQKWHAGDIDSRHSSGMAIRDYPKGDGSLHVRVRSRSVKANQRIAPPPDLMMAVNIKLPSDLVGPYRGDSSIAMVDVERVVKGERIALEDIDSLLSAAHEDASREFEGVFEKLALDYFRGLESGADK